MAKNKKETFINHTLKDIDAFVAEKREELRALRFSVAGSKNRNVKHVGNLKREVARALTARPHAK